MIPNKKDLLKILKKEQKRYEDKLYSNTIKDIGQLIIGNSLNGNKEIKYYPTPSSIKNRIIKHLKSKGYRVLDHDRDSIGIDWS